MTQKGNPKPIKPKSKEIGTMVPKDFQPTGVSTAQGSQNQLRNYMAQLLGQHYRVDNPQGIPPILQMLIGQQADKMSQPTKLNPLIVERRRDTNRMADVMRRMGKL